MKHSSGAIMPFGSATAGAVFRHAGMRPDLFNPVREDFLNEDEK